MSRQAATENPSTSEPRAARSIAQELRRLILLSALPFVALIGLLGYVGYQDARSNAEVFVRRQAMSVSIDVAKLLGETERGLRLLAARPGVQRMDPAHCDPGLGDLIVIEPRYVNVNMTDREGWVICGAVLPTGGRRSENRSDREWFQAVRAGKSFAMGTARKGSIVGRWITTAGAPVRGAGGEMAGAVSVSLDLVKWEPPGSGDVIPVDAVLGVLDAAGTIMMRFPDADKWVGRDGRDTPITQTMLRIRDGVFAAPGSQGFERIWAVIPIPGTDWLAFAGVRSTTVLAPALTQTAYAMALATAALMLAAWLAILASRRLARPIAAIAQAARARASGGDDLVPVAGPSEVSELAQALNRMIQARQQAENALRESEALLNEMGRIARIGGWAIDLAKGTLNWTRQVYEIHEVGEDFHPTVEAAIHFYAPESRPVIQQAVEQAIQNGQAFDLELELITARGRRIWVHALGYAVVGNGKTIGLAGTFRDITVRKLGAIERDRLEAQLRESQKMEALGTLAGGVAHDFNNILAMITGNVELARQDVGPGHPALESLEEIGKASRRARDLVQQILAFSRRQTLERKATSLSLVVLESARLLRAGLPAKVRLNVECRTDTPAVLADATQVSQILVNLCNNALTAVRDLERPGVIDVRLEAHTQGEARGDLRPGRYACLTVRDNGAGMDEATRARIFEPFFTTKQMGKGTGLGLSVVHGIAQAHQASIEVESIPGQGSEFRIYFPALEGQIPADESPPPEIPSAAGNGKRILFVDDEEGLVLLMKRLLTRQGYRVTGYTDPREALAAVRAGPDQFDLVVTDYNMPGMSGLELAIALREVRADLPVVLASGYITEELRAQAPAEGIREVIFKPNTVDELCAAVARVANSQSGKSS